MPSIRVGFSSDLNIRGGKVGFGTTNLTANLEVAGQITAEDAAGSGGVSTFREYQGFSQSEARISNNITIDNSDGGPFSSLTGEIKITGETTVSSGSTIEVGKTKTLTVTDKFAVPLGDTNDRDNTPEPGTTRFNQDFGTLEFFDGVNWKTVNSYSRGGAAGRGVFAGGRAPGVTSRMDYITISTLGNAQDFGTLTAAHSHINGVASSTRGIIGINGGNLNYFTIASKGNGIQFGTYENSAGYGSASSSTRGLFAGGYNPTANAEIEYVEIATLGNAIDFGNLFTGKYYLNGVSNGTRASFGGGFIPGPAVVSRIESVIISSKGNAIKFGDLSVERSQGASVCNSVRGIFAGGFDPAPSHVMNLIDYVTIATEGTATYFGDCTASLGQRYGGCSSQTRGVYGGGSTAPGDPTNIMEYVTISTAGNAIDFGDLPLPTRANAGVSDSHGGLGGF